MKAMRILSLVVVVVMLLGLALGSACTGARGEQGADGVGIQSIVNNADGTLTIVLTNGQTYTTLNLTGPQGLQGPQGEQGPQGIQGAEGDTGPAGAGVQWKGEWSSSTTYVQNDAVGYQGSSYISRQEANTNHVPTDTAWWDLWAEKGDTGAQGIQGVQGIQGDPGGLYFGTPVVYDPSPYAIGAGYDSSWDFGVLYVADKISLTFTVSGNPVYYWVSDRYNNVIITGNEGNPASSGGAGFIVGEQGHYYIVFSNPGPSSSIITLHYTYFPHL